MVNTTIKNLNPKDIKCDWIQANNTDACNHICTCWKFPEDEKIVANCLKIELLLQLQLRLMIERTKS